MRTSVRRFLIGIFATCAAFGARAQTASDFYRGKTVRLIIGMGEGGGYDLSARLVAQYLPQFIPGHPTVVPENMSGAGSIDAAEYVYNVAPKDGTIISIVQPTFMLEKLSDRSRRYEPANYRWIGRLDQNMVMGLIWHNSPAQSVEAAKHTPVVIAANGAIGTSATIPWALNCMIGTKYKVVLGYDSSAKMGLALENGEADALGSTSWDFLQTKPQWFKDKQATIPYVIALQRFDKLPNVPTVLELVDKPLDKNAMKLVASTSTLGQAFMMPPGVPSDRVAVVRAAFSKMVRDPAFLADAQKRRLGVDPLDGADLQKIVQDVMSQPQSVVQRMKDATQPER